MIHLFDFQSDFLSISQENRTFLGKEQLNINSQFGDTWILTLTTRHLQNHWSMHHEWHFTKKKKHIWKWHKSNSNNGLSLCHCHVCFVLRLCRISITRMQNASVRTVFVHLKLLSYHSIHDMCTCISNRCCNYRGECKTMLSDDLGEKKISRKGLNFCMWSSM